MSKEDDSKRKPTRRVSEWTPAVELLSGIFDRLGEQTQVTAALGGANPRKVPTAPYPATAIERARHRRRIQNHRALVARVIPQNKPASE